MSQNEVSFLGPKWLPYISETTDTSFSDIPILMIGDNCLVHSPQLLQFKMYVLFLLGSPSWIYSIHSASQLVVCCQVTLVKSWSRWSNCQKSVPSWWKKSEVVGHKLVKSRWNVGQKMVKGWSRWWSIVEKMLQVGQVGDKLVMVKGWWKIGGVGEFVAGWSSWWKVGEVGEFVKSWSIWSRLWKNGKVGEFGRGLVKLVKS